MKKWLVVLMATWVAGLAQARVVDAWNYDGLTNGSFISSAMSTGTVGNAKFAKGKGEDVIQNGMIRWVHDDVVNSNGAYFSSATVSDPTVSGFDSGIFQLDVDYVAADFALTAASTNSDASGRVFFLVRDTALSGNDRDVGCRLWYDSRVGVTNITEEVGGPVTNVVDYDEFRLEGIYKGTGGIALTNFTGSTSMSNLHVRMVMNLNTNEVEYLITHDGGPEVSVGTGVIDSTWTVQELRMQKQSRNGDTWWEEGDTMFTDNLIFSVLEMPTLPPPPEIGSLWITNMTSIAHNFPVTNSLLSVANVRAGDVIVVTAASNKGSAPTESDVEASGTATLSAFTFLKRSHGAASLSWYATVEAAGSLELSIGTAGVVGFATVGAYQLTSDSGIIELLDTSVDGGSLVTSATNDYYFGNLYSGIYFEAFSSYGGSAAATDPNVVIDNNVAGKRVVAHGPFTDVIELRTVWTCAQKQAALVGLAFAAVAADSPSQIYADWISGYSVGSATNMMIDADGDHLDNLSEYAFGGEPDNNAIRGNTPVQSLVNDGGTEYLQYVYFERDDVGDRGLSSVLNVGTDLVITDWTTNGVEFVGSGASAVPGYTAVTNRVPDGKIKQFLRLQVEFTP
jgi:hypothetical protein